MYTNLRIIAYILTCVYIPILLLTRKREKYSIIIRFIFSLLTALVWSTALGFSLFIDKNLINTIGCIICCWLWIYLMALNVRAFKLHCSLERLRKQK